MDLVQKGASADLGADLRSLTVTMGWETPTDFDLGAVFERKDGTHGVIYFGNTPEELDKAHKQQDSQGIRQSLDGPPYMLLSGDAGVGDSKDKGGNEETLKIASIADMNWIWVVGWDYPAVGRGAPARFQGSGLKLRVVDQSGQEHNVTLSLAEGDLAPKGNVCMIATIDNTGETPKLTNSSHTALFDGLKTSEQFWDFVQAAQPASPAQQTATA